MDMVAECKKELLEVRLTEEYFDGVYAPVFILVPSVLEESESVLGSV